MAKVYIPALLQNLTGGNAQLDIEGSTVREIIDNLEQKYPGIKDRLVESSQLRPNISVAIDGEITPLGMLEGVAESSEVHFVAAIRGGRAG
jgi:molybdopterin synthase sulfur carrier subunit